MKLVKTDSREKNVVVCFFFVKFWTQEDRDFFFFKGNAVIFVYFKNCNYFNGRRRWFSVYFHEVLKTRKAILFLRGRL